MNSRFEFNLTPAYCLYNGVAVLEQNGTSIRFLIENEQNEILKTRLKRAFENHLGMIRKIRDCPEIYRRLPAVDFISGNRSELRKLVSRLYSTEGNAEKRTVGRYEAEFGEVASTGSAREAEKSQREAAAVLLLDSILNEARVRNATDIHIEQNLVRLRINGQLEKLMEIQSEKTAELIQRIKLLAGMNVIEKRRCQDGHFVYGNQNPFFLRVSTMSVVGQKYVGEESVVIRLLDTERIPLELDHLGYNLMQLEHLESIIQNPNGLILVCGPTGSGKSTTVASLLVDIEKRSGDSLKILSLEDPPEYVIPGVTQIKVDEQNGFTEALKHLFRQDPDIIMIGEIRDEQSAAAALRAALTGHLVFATLHAGSSGEAVLRLENLGLERKMFCPVLRAVISQELNFLRAKNQLYADIAVPKMSFSTRCLKAKSEDDFDACFEHFTNYSDILQETMRELSDKRAAEAGENPGSGEKTDGVEKTNGDESLTHDNALDIRRLPYFNGGKNAKRIHGRAV